MEQILSCVKPLLKIQDKKSVKHDQIFSLVKQLHLTFALQAHALSVRPPPPPAFSSIDQHHSIFYYFMHWSITNLKIKTELESIDSIHITPQQDFYHFVGQAINS